ncbi:MAG: hypothetical protein JWM43_3919 [Acidobacteriaceae bacterium]|nr:hypothetical protein [Acidobacteriaceae bacterium]
MKLLVVELRSKLVKVARHKPRYAIDEDLIALVGCRVMARAGGSTNAGDYSAVSIAGSRAEFALLVTKSESE